MNKKDYDNLKEEERQWIGNSDEGWKTFAEFWINGLTHIVISKKPDGTYQILRGWVGFKGVPATSVDYGNVTIEDVVQYLILKLNPVPPTIEKNDFNKELRELAESGELKHVQVLSITKDGIKPIESKQPKTDELKNLTREDLKAEIRGKLNTFNYNRNSLLKILKLLEEE